MFGRHSLTHGSRLVCSLPLVLAAAGTALAQQPASRPSSQPPRATGAPPSLMPEQQRAAMEKLAYMAGEWQGEGWMAQGDRRMSFRGGERVQRKLGGLALLVEGDFSARVPGQAEEMPVHTTLGVISYDPRAERYRFETWLASGAAGEHGLELIEHGWRWHIPTPNGTIRYTTTFDTGDWLEIGEMRQGEGRWTQFFEMRLTRVE